MVRLIVVTAAMALSGCASTQDVLSKPVQRTVHSTKSATAVAFCLADRNDTPALEQEDGGRVILVKNGYGAVGMAFTVYPAGTGSRIEIREAFNIIGASHRRCYQDQEPDA